MSSAPRPIVWAAEHGYPYIALNTPIDRTKQIWEIYDNVAAEAGFTGGPDYHGMLKQIHVAETEEKALENAAQFSGCRASSPVSPTRCGARPRVTEVPKIAAPLSSLPPAGRKTRATARSWKNRLEDLMIIAGTPKQVIAKLRILLEETRPGILGIWGNDGNVTHEDAKTCIRLLGQEVFPALREMAKEFDLKSPFETNQPVSVDYMDALKEPARAAAE